MHVKLFALYPDAFNILTDQVEYTPQIRTSDSDSSKVYAAIVEPSEPRRAIAAASHI